MDRGGFWPAVALTLAGHAAVLGYLGTRSPEPGLMGLAQPQVPAFQVRVVTAGAGPAQPEAVTEAAAPLVAAAPVVQEQPVPEAAPAQSVVPAVPAATQPAPATVVAAAAPSADPPYLRRGELTVPPKLLTAVQVPFPEDVKGFVELKVQLTLFIDEQGAVQRVRVDQEVHPSFIRVVQETFGAAKFSPGELERLPVRSQVRMEVEFHSPSRRRS